MRWRLIATLMGFISGCFGGTISWVAVGNTPNTIMTSETGLTWTGLGSNVFDVAGYDVTYSEEQNIWIAVGEDSTNTIANSIDGVNWNPSISAPFSTRGNSIAYSIQQNRWVSTGLGTNCFAHSFDGITWIGDGCPAGVTEGTGVDYSSIQNKWIASVVAGGTTPKLYSSLDGINWSIISPTIPQYEDGSVTSTTTVAYSESLNQWLTFGKESGGVPSHIVYSNDGITWTKTTFGASLTIIYRFYFSETTQRWIGVGFIDIATNSVFYSDDGINWISPTPSSSTFPTWGRGITYRIIQNRWIAVGPGGAEHNFAYSDDNGVNWTKYGGTTLSTEVRMIGSREPTCGNVYCTCPVQSCLCVDTLCSVGDGINDEIVILETSQNIIGIFQMNSTISLQINSSALITVLGDVILNAPKLILSIDDDFSVNRVNQRNIQSYEILTLQSNGTIEGQFRSLEIKHDLCTGLVGNIEYQPNSISVVVDSTNVKCDKQETVNNALVIGIALGCVAMGTIVAVIISLLWKYQKNKITTLNKTRIKKNAMEKLTRESSENRKSDLV